MSRNVGVAAGDTRWDRLERIGLEFIGCKGFLLNLENKFKRKSKYFRVPKKFKKQKKNCCSDGVNNFKCINFYSFFMCNCSCNYFVILYTIKFTRLQMQRQLLWHGLRTNLFY